MRLAVCAMICIVSGCSRDPGRSQQAATGSGGQPNIIPSAVAKEHKGEACTVELVVRASKKEPDRKVHYLDSEVDYKDPKNFAIVIADEAVDRFAKAGIENPAVYYKGKTIRVTGTIVYQEDQYQIVASEPSQIQVVAEPE